jgi:hypothetical protein
MTLQRTEIEQARFEAVKVLRAAVRLRHSIAADRELNEVLPQFDKAFTAAIQRGELPEPQAFLELVNA